MRALTLALALALTAGAANAQRGTANTGADIAVQLPTRNVPGGARKEAEEAIKHDLGDPDSAKFRAVRTSEVASVRQSSFSDPIEGPVSIVCGQVSSKDQKGDYGADTWFFVAIKRGHVLWTTSDDASGAQGDAYLSCKGAGLAE